MENGNKKDILVFEDIQLLVNTFYTRVREDELLGPVFEERLSGRWEKHLDKMYSFWQTILLGQRSYQGSPLVPHLDMPVDAAHFDRWVGIFHKTLEDLFDGEVADEARWRAERMAEMFAYKIEYFRQNQGAIQ